MKFDELKEFGFEVVVKVRDLFLFLFWKRILIYVGYSFCFEIILILFYVVVVVKECGLWGLGII